ncbi:hypothetical protein V6R21_32225 [Limibacter armeniacum]|uniref:hypothetical protein n=1 Tax=Limibacter armeniacum TaxID=466084 RepID=UPI002FE5F1AC
MISITVSGEVLPVDKDTSINFVVDSDYFNLEYLSGTHTYSFVIPYTGASKKVFGFEHMPEVYKNNFINTYDCQISFKGFTLISGKLILQRCTSKGYEVFVTSNTSILAEIKEVTLPELFSIKIIGYLDRNTQLVQEGYTPVADLFASDDFQQILTRTNEDSVVFDDSVFCISTTYLLEQLFAALGYEMEMILRFPAEQYKSVMWFTDHPNNGLYWDTAYDIAPPSLTVSTFLNALARNFGIFTYFDTVQNKVTLMDIHSLPGYLYYENNYGFKYLDVLSIESSEKGHIDKVSFSHNTKQGDPKPTLNGTVDTYQDLPPVNFASGETYYVRANTSWYKSIDLLWQPILGFNRYPKEVVFREGDQKMEINTGVDPVYMVNRGKIIKQSSFDLVRPIEPTNTPGYLGVQIRYDDTDPNNEPLPDIEDLMEVEIYYKDNNVEVRRRGLITSHARTHSQGEEHFLNIGTNIPLTFPIQEELDGEFEFEFTYGFRYFPEITGDKSGRIGHLNHSNFPDYQPIDDYEGNNYNYVTATNYQTSNPQIRLSNRQDNQIQYSLIWDDEEGLYETFHKRAMLFLANCKLIKIKPKMTIADIISYQPFSWYQTNNFHYLPKKLTYKLTHDGIKDVKMEARVPKEGAVLE